MRWKRRVYEILEVAAPGDRTSRRCDLFILWLIALNTVALVAETVDSVHQALPHFFGWFEIVSVLIFTVEYALRVWSCTASTEYAAPMRGRLRFAATPFAIIDFLAVLPFYLPFVFVGVDLRMMRAVRLFRLFRLAKLVRYSTALRTFGRVFTNKKEELVTTLFVLLLLLLLASSLVYYAEHEAQADEFSSIPATMWWGITTLTTVGYGDLSPITPVGKLLGAVIAVLGIGMFALPTGILGAAFLEELEASKEPLRRCPHCGEEIGGG